MIGNKIKPYRRFGKTEVKSDKKSKLKIIPLGGLDEIGKNITVFEYGKEIVIIDCGLAFPDDEMLGVDIVIPDMTYLVKNRERIRESCLLTGMRTISAHCRTF